MLCRLLVIMAPVVLVILSYQYILFVSQMACPILGSSPSADKVGEISLVLRAILCEGGALGIMRS